MQLFLLKILWLYSNLGAPLELQWKLEQVDVEIQ